MHNKFPYRYRVLVLLFTLILITFIDRICISILGVRIKNDLHLTNTQFGWVLAAFSLAYAIFEIPAGILGDRIGQRNVLMRIVICWSIFTALTGLTTGLLSLVMVRFLFGAGEAGAIPNGSGVVARWFPVNETGTGIASLIVGSSVGAGIAPLIIVPIAAAYGWRVPFFILALAGIVWVMVCYAWFRNHPGEMNGISKTEKDLIEKNRRYAVNRHLTNWKTVILQKNVVYMMIAYFCGQCALYFFIAWMPVYLQQGRNFTEDQMKTTTSVLFLFGIAGGLSSGFFNDWMIKKKGLIFTRRLLVAAPYTIMALLFFIAGTAQSNHVVRLALTCCYPFVPFAGITVISTCVDIGENNTSTVSGIVNFSGQVGAFFLAIVFGKLVDVTRNYNAPLFLISGLMLMAAFTWMNVNPEKKIGVIAV